MTQAFNLSQLANRVNTSGQLNAANGLFNQTPVANGGTGKSSVTSGRLLVGAGTSAMTELAGTTAGDAVTWNGTSWVAGAVGGAPPEIQVFTSSGTWTKAAGLKKIKVTVVGAGGNGGAAPATPTGLISGNGGAGGGGGAAIEYIPAPSIPGPVAVTAGTGTNSFGAFCSATAGGNGTNLTRGPAGPIAGVPASGGSGSGGNLNTTGSTGKPQSGGSSLMGGSVFLNSPFVSGFSSNGLNGLVYGGGGTGALKLNPPVATSRSGGTGAPGVVIVEEFY
jgi:hypothetical protein